jgi:transposase
VTVERLRAGRTVRQAAAASGVDPKTVREWRDRHAAEGEVGLMDRPSRPRRSRVRLDEAVGGGDRGVFGSTPEAAAA